MTYTPPLSRRSALGLLAAVPVTLASPLVIRPAKAMAPETYAEDGVAIDGSDVMGYWLDGEPVMGSPDFTYDWKGATWQFASAETRDMFITDPERYAPAYGGHCAWAASRGYVAPTTPTAWTLHEERLFLNYSLGVQWRWRRNIPGNVAKGDENWPGLLAG